MKTVIASRPTAGSSDPGSPRKVVQLTRHLLASWDRTQWADGCGARRGRMHGVRRCEGAEQHDVAGLGPKRSGDRASWSAATAGWGFSAPLTNLYGQRQYRCDGAPRPLTAR